MITIFKRRFKKKIKDEFIRDDRTYEILTKIIEIAVGLNDKLYERALDDKYDEGFGSNAGRYLRLAFGRYNSSKPKRSEDSYYGPISRELDSI